MKKKDKLNLDGRGEHGPGGVHGQGLVGCNRGDPKPWGKGLRRRGVNRGDKNAYLWTKNHIGAGGRTGDRKSKSKGRVSSARRHAKPVGNEGRTNGGVRNGGVDGKALAGGIKGRGGT